MKRGTKEISGLFAIAFIFAVLMGNHATVSAQAFSEQVSRQVKEDLDLTREVIQVKRKAIVALNLGLTDYESKAFWPVYEEYWAEMTKLGDRDVALISDFAKHYVYESLTNKRAEEMIKEWMSIKKEELKLKEKYLKKFKKAIPEKKVFRYFQIENKLDLIIDTELAAQIPLAR